MNHTLRGDSLGASNLSLFLHRSIKVNLPVFPVAENKKILECNRSYVETKYLNSTYHEQEQKRHPEMKTSAITGPTIKLYFALIT